MLYYFCCLLKPLLWIILRPRIVNYKHLLVKGPAIIISNHWAFSDPILVASVILRPVHFMAKSELFHNPVTAFFLKHLYAFPVDKNKADIQSLKKAQALLKEGKVFGIFPEGSRSVTGRFDMFMKGAAFLALRNNVTVIPVYSDPNTFRRFKIRMIVGEPIDPQKVIASGKGKSVDVLTRYFEDTFQDMQNRMEVL